MAGYQNNMRYGRPGNMYQQRNAGCNCVQRMPERCGNECRNEHRILEHRANECCEEQRMAEHCMPERSGNECHKEQHMGEHRGNKCCKERHEVVREEKERREHHKEKRDCDCAYRKDELAGMPLAMAYVPWQKWCKIYDVCEGFQRGTIFRELDMPFEGKGGCNR